jgi:hypothetical protein
MSEKEKEFRERLEKEQIEKEQREKEQKKQKEKKQKEKEYQNWKNAQLMSGNLAKPTQYEPGKPISTKSFIVILGGIFLFIISSIFFLTPKNLSLSVEEGLKKIEIAKAMEICASPPYRITSVSGELESALIDLSKDEGMSLYIDESFKKHYYHIIGWSDGSKNIEEEDRELKDGCTYLINNDEKFSKEFNRVWGKKLEQSNALAAAETEKEEADRVRFAPQLEKWDNKLSDLGGSGVVNYLTALSKAENFIQQGAAYSLTGVARGAVQSVSCDPTNRSMWRGGVPTGWWSCLIDFEGSDYDVFSIEFTENSWRGVPDRGRQAGTDLKNIEIPQDLIEWLGKQE